MELNKIFDVILCLFIFTQILNVSATLPLTKINEAKENKLIKTKELKKNNNNDLKTMFKVEGKKLNTSSTPKVGQPKKLAVESKLPVLPKLSETKTVRTSIGLQALQTNTVDKETSTQKSLNTRTRLQNTVSERKLSPRSNTKPEHFLQESKVVEVIDKKLNPIMNMLTQISRDLTKNTQIQKMTTLNVHSAKVPNQNSMMTRQFHQQDSLERAETIHRGVKHIKNFMKILEQVDSFLSSKASSAIEQLSHIYEGDRRLKVAKLSLKDKLNLLKGTPL